MLRAAFGSTTSGARLTFLEERVRDEGAAEGAGGAGGPALGQRAEAGLAEHVAARVAAERAVVHVQTHGAGEALSVALLAVRQHAA